MGIHEEAAAGFSRAAADYELFRPSYPAAAIEFLAADLGLAPGRSALDLGAGTGKLTRLLLATGAEIVAVEPIDEMRAELERAVPGVPALAGRAEAIPLGDATVDAVLVAQAFHWFDHERALPEIHRVLRPGGALALLWNVWDTAGSRALARLDALVEARRGTTPSLATGDWETTIFAAGPLFGPLEERSFPNPATMPREALVARVSTISFVAAWPGEERERLLDEVRAILADEPEPVDTPSRTSVFVSRRL